MRIDRGSSVDVSIVSVYALWSLWTSAHLYDLRTVGKRLPSAVSSVFGFPPLPQVLWLINVRMECQFERIEYKNGFFGFCVWIDYIFVVTSACLAWPDCTKTRATAKRWECSPGFVGGIRSVALPDDCVCMGVGVVKRITSTLMTVIDLIGSKLLLNLAFTNDARWPKVDTFCAHLHATTPECPGSDPGTRGPQAERHRSWTAGFPSMHPYMHLCAHNFHPLVTPSIFVSSLVSELTTCIYWALRNLDFQNESTRISLDQLPLQANTITRSQVKHFPRGQRERYHVYINTVHTCSVVAASPAVNPSPVLCCSRTNPDTNRLSQHLC